MMLNSKKITNQTQTDLKIVIADDHALVRGGLALMIEMTAPDAQLIQANSFSQVKKILEENKQVDLLLLDLMMPGMDNGNGIESICQTWPDIPVVIVSVDENFDTIRHALKSGAMGYIPKTSTPEITVSAIQLVLDGGIYIPPHIMNLRGDTESESNGDNPDQKSELSKRQLQVLDLITDGKSNKSIAEELGLSTGTIKMHVSGIFKKLNVTNRTEAVARYSKRKIDFDNQE